MLALGKRVDSPPKTLTRGWQDLNPQQAALKAAVLPLNYTPGRSGSLKPKQAQQVHQKKYNNIHKEGSPGQARNSPKAEPGRTNPHKNDPAKDQGYLKAGAQPGAKKSDACQA